MTPTLHPSPIDSEKAKAIWNDYQSNHDISTLKTKTVGIDPESGEIWFGTSALDVSDQQEKRNGNSKPLFFIEVGKDYYVRKGGRR